MKMKTLLTGLLFVLITGTSYSQDCIKKFVGTYGINIDGTIAAVREADPSKENEEVPEEFLDMVKQMTLEISMDSMTVSMMGQRQSIKITPRASELDGASCDLLLDIPVVDVPKEQAPFVTIYEGKNNTMMLKSTNGSNDMDNFIWMKIE
jgi:hypothetical protein